MQSLLHADVFFFITSVAVILVTVALTIVLIYIIQIVHHLKRFTQRLHDEGDKIIDDVSLVRATMRDKVIHLLGLLGAMAGKVKSAAKKKGHKKSSSKK